jgi:hypothetical protein
MTSRLEINHNNMERLREHQREKLLEWAQSVFAEPTVEGKGINSQLYQQAYVGREQEAILYKDLNSRDSELGLGLLDWRKAELLDAIAYLKSAIKKREHAAALLRSRLDALQRLATNRGDSPSTELVQTEQLECELTKIVNELHYLRTYSSKIESLERITKLIGSESTLRVTRTSEQILRLFSQSWRGLVKVRAWQQHFEDNHLPSLQPYKQPGELEGFLLPLGDARAAVAISRETGGYLLHLLEAIKVLAEDYRTEVLQAKSITGDAWSSAHRLIRAITELFYFCNFEMPFSYIDLAMDPEDSSQLCVYSYELNEWQIVSEDFNSGRTLKRVGAEAAQLLVNGYTLLKLHQDQELNDFISAEIKLTDLAEGQNYRLFMCSGLSDFDLDPASQRVKFRMALNAIQQLLPVLATNQSELALLTNSALGGITETLIGMALLDNRAFSFPATSGGLDPLARFQVLSHFWRVIGRRRAIAMMGEDYVKQVTNGLASLGEQGPDHPTFLTMRANTMFATTPGLVTAAPTTLAEAQSALLNPFTSLGLSDQIRLLDLAIQSWKIASELLDKLRDVHSQGKLRRIIESLPVVITERKEDIQLRFNTKWLMANNWQWTFMRTCTPVAWDFWTKISGNEDWDGLLLALPPYQALGQLLRLFSDIVRLILVMELSGAEVAQSIQIEAESAGQEIMCGLEGFLREGERLPPQVAEAINFYYDPEVRFDSWLAFTSSFRRYLKQMGQDLRTLNVDAKLLQSIDGLISQIEILYPLREGVTAVLTPVAETPTQQPLPLTTIDEALAQQIDTTITQTLAVGEQDHLTFFKVLSLAIRPDKQALLAFTVSYQTIVQSLLPDPAQRLLLFNLPSETRQFLQFLNNLRDQGPPTPTSLQEMQPQLADYFAQLEEMYRNLLPWTKQLPNILPNDRQRLANYLTAAPQKSNGLDYLLMLVGNRLVLDVSDFDEPLSVQAERAETKVRAYLREQLQAAIDEPSIEIYPLGSGRIVARPQQCIVTATAGLDAFEPFWLELSQPISQALYQRYAGKKLAIVTQLLTKEFPEVQVLGR